MISSSFLIYLVYHVFLTRKFSNNKRKFKLLPKLNHGNRTKSLIALTERAIDISTSAFMTQPHFLSLTQTSH